MHSFVSHTGRAVPLRRSGVDTDQIIPAEFCKRVAKSGFEDALFARWREEPGFVLNVPERAGATILVAGPEFGIGSSREHAVWALRDWGFLAVIAPGFGDIFRRNALTNGLLAVALPEDVVEELMAAAEADPGFEITVDLEDRAVRAGGRAWDFEIDERSRWLLLNGYDEIQATLERLPAIESYERCRPGWMPVLGSAVTAR